MPGQNEGGDAVLCHARAGEPTPGGLALIPYHQRRRSCTRPRRPLLPPPTPSKYPCRRRRNTHPLLARLFFSFSSSAMAARPQPSHEGPYSSPSPPADAQDPFAQPRYYDENSADYPYRRRDTYGSDSSAAGLNDGDRYYDHAETYGPCSHRLALIFPVLRTNFASLLQVNPTQTQNMIFTPAATCPLLNPSVQTAWECPTPQGLPGPTSVAATMAIASLIPLGAQSDKFLSPRRRSRTSS